MNSLLLALNTWDLTVDAAGNIAMATNGYAIAQDVACACRLFAGELLLDSSQGLPYFEQILGHLPPAQFLKARFIAAAKTVPEVANVECFLSFDVRTRVLTAQLQITTTAGEALVTGGAVQGTVPWYINAASPLASGSSAGGP